jgi:N-acetylglucosamine kinase-like BadF-type ATPase
MSKLLGKFPIEGVLAVDGGASKADLALVDMNGKLLAAKRTRGRYNFGLGSNGSFDAMNQAIQSLIPSHNGRRVAATGIYCLAGADIPIDDRRIAAELRAQGWTTRTIVRNDTFAVMRAGTERNWGVAVVCGTGMNCAGVGPDGRSVRFPSFGELSGDRAHGGGWLGRTALGAAIRARDGRGRRTQLETLVPAHFGMSRPAELMEAIYVGRIDYDRVSELAPLVIKAAARGDEVARGMLDEMIEEIVVTAGAAIKRLRLTATDVHVVLGGGVMRGADRAMLAKIRAGIQKLAPKASAFVLDAPPVLGAALIGLDEMGAPAQAGRRLRRILTHRRLSLA